jgi:fumarylacetoacetate (FAA) hydrolase
MVDVGTARTGYMKFGDRVRMSARTPDGRRPFGVIDQCVVEARRVSESGRT